MENKEDSMPLYMYIFIGALIGGATFAGIHYGKSTCECPQETSYALEFSTSRLGAYTTTL